MRWYPFAGDELVYCDPPYLFETSSSDRPRYVYELGDEDTHRALLDILTALPSMVMLSGYWSQLYADHRNWHSIQFQEMTHGGPRTEWLWCNFPEPITLHDYRYLGVGSASASASSARNRDGQPDCTACPLLERRALLAAIEEMWPDLHSPKTTMPPVAPSFSAMPGPASPEPARADPIAANDDGGRHRHS